VSRPLVLLGGIAGTCFLPAMAVLALVGVAGNAAACVPGPAGGGPLAPTAPVPAPARAWVALTQAGCPALPATWIAAVMARESSFRPDAAADDANGGTRGLFQLGAAEWARAYGGEWHADRDRDGTWDVNQPEIHARVAGGYLCRRLEGVRAIRAAHPD